MLNFLVFGIAVTAFVIFILKKSKWGKSLFGEKPIDSPWTYSLCSIFGAAIMMFIIAQPIHYLLVIFQMGVATPLGPGVYSGLILLLGDGLTFGILALTAGVFGAAFAACVDGTLRLFKLERKRWLINLLISLSLPALQAICFLVGTLTKGVSVPLDDYSIAIFTVEFACSLAVYTGSALFVLFNHLFETHRPRTTVTGTIIGVTTLAWLILPALCVAISLNKPMFLSLIHGLLRR